MRLKTILLATARQIALNDIANAKVGEWSALNCATRNLNIVRKIVVIYFTIGRKRKIMTIMCEGYAVFNCEPNVGYVIIQF